MTTAKTEKAAAAAGAKGEDRKPRAQMTKVLEISIAPSRCKTLMRDLLHPHKQEEETLKARAEELGAKAKLTKKDREEQAKILERRQELSAESVRLGAHASVVMATVCDHAVKTLTEFALDSKPEEANKLEVDAIHSPGLEALDIYPLIAGRPVIRDYDPLREKELKEARAEANKAAKEAKKKQAEDGQAAAQPKEPAGDNEPANFQTYVNEALDAMKAKKLAEGKEKAEREKRPAEAITIRFSSRYREVMKTLVEEIITYLTGLTVVAIETLLPVSTMNHKNVQGILTLLYAERLGREKGEETLAPLLSEVAEKVKLHMAHYKKEEGDAPLTEEQQRQATAKKLEKATKRSQKLAAQVKASIEEVKKAKSELAAQA